MSFPMFPGRQRHTKRPLFNTTHSRPVPGPPAGTLTANQSRCRGGILIRIGFFLCAFATMTSTAQVLIALAFGLVAVLYQIEADPSTWQATNHGSIYASSEQLERFITNPDSVEKWFHLVSLFKAADSRPLGIGKKYQAIYDIPLFGEYSLLLTMVDYKPNKLITLESNSLFRPRFTIKLEDDGPKTTRLVFTMQYRRTSALFQWFLGPFLCFVTGQQFQRSLFLLRMMFPF